MHHQVLQLVHQPMEPHHHLINLMVSQLMEHHHQALQLTVLIHLVLLWVRQRMVLHLLPMVLHLLPMDNRCLQARLANNRLLSKLIIN